MRASRVSCLASVVLAAILMTGSAAGQTFTDTTRVAAVQIPVQVVADGKPVRGLTAADCVVHKGRRERPGVGFDAVDLQTLPAGDLQIRTAVLTPDGRDGGPDGADRLRAVHRRQLEEESS